MAAVTLAEAKQHLRVIGNAEDAQIQLYLDAAEQQAANFIKRPIPWDDGAVPPVAVPVPAPVKAAILLILGDLFENREGVITGTIVAGNPSVNALLWPYRMQSFF